MGRGHRMGCSSDSVLADVMCIRWGIHLTVGPRAPPEELGCTVGRAPERMRKAPSLRGRLGPS
jgi:hypothetical protein